MITEDEVLDALRAVADPCAIATGVPVDIVAMGLVHAVLPARRGVTVTLRLTSPFCMQVGLITSRCEQALRRLPGVGPDTDVRIEVDAALEWMPEDMHPDARAALRRIRPLPVASAS
ncbi:MAG TPA: iron-sulfur cluster assembly protein [Pseudonocardia sp.]|jgi:metal-sulfur cluster biosynthetic enzyme